MTIGAIPTPAIRFGALDETVRYGQADFSCVPAFRRFSGFSAGSPRVESLELSGISKIGQDVLQIANQYAQNIQWLPEQQRLFGFERLLTLVQEGGALRKSLAQAVKYLPQDKQIEAYGRLAEVYA